MRTCRRARLSRPCIIVGISAACIIIYLLSLSNRGAKYIPPAYNSRNHNVKNRGIKSLSKPALSRPSNLDPNGLGEGGTAVHLPNLSPEDKKELDQSVETYAVNQFVSEKISLHRTLGDGRHKL